MPRERDIASTGPDGTTPDPSTSRVGKTPRKSKFASPIVKPHDSLARVGGSFGLLNQNGPFALREGEMTRAEIVEWSNSLSLGERTDFRTARNTITQALGVNSLMEVDEIFDDPEKMEAARIRANRKFAEKFGLEGSDGEIAEIISGKKDSYAITADEVRNRVAQEIRGARLFEQSNEAAGANDIIALLRLQLRGADARVRFEAQLKLEEMKLAAADDKREREEAERRTVEFELAKIRFTREGRDPREARTGTEGSFYELQQFLDRYVFRSEKTGGDITMLASHHRASDFACESVTRLPQKQAAFVMQRRPPKGMRYTPIKERSFVFRGRTIPIYSTPRLKETESSIIKLFRKGTTNSAGAVEDKIGLMAVLQDERDIDAFNTVLMQGANEAELPFDIEELEDSLGNSSYSARNAGSSQDFRALKGIPTIGSIRFELLEFDHPGYIDNLYRDGVSHKEMQAKRLFESGVAEHFFPEAIYGVSHVRQQAFVLSQIRREMRNNGDPN